MKYKLRYLDLELGVVTLEDRSFPNSFGVIDYSIESNNVEGDEVRRMLKFIELNRESTRLMDIEHEIDVEEEMDQINQQLELYMDYVESDDWKLVDREGKVHLILCPILRAENEIVWRWSVS